MLTYEEKDKRYRWRRLAPLHVHHTSSIPRATAASVASAAFPPRRPMNLEKSSSSSSTSPRVQPRRTTPSQVGLESDFQGLDLTEDVVQLTHQEEASNETSQIPNIHLANEYIFDVMHAWRERLGTFLPDSVSQDDGHGNFIRNNAREGLFIQSSEGHFVQCTPENVLKIGKRGKNTITFTESTETLPDALQSSTIREAGIIDIGHFCFSHHGITSGAFLDDASLVLERDEVSVANLQESHQRAYPVLSPPSESIKLPSMHGITMKDLLPSADNFALSKPQVACETDADNSYKISFYKRRKINGNLFIKMPDENYDRIRQALIISSNANNEATTMYNSFIHDGKDDIFFETHDSLENECKSISPFAGPATAKPESIASAKKINYHLRSSIHLMINPSTADIFHNDLHQYIFSADFVNTLLHESGHAYQIMCSRKRSIKLFSQDNSKFTNELEREIILGVEARTQRNRGGQERDNHYGITYSTNGDVTSTSPLYPDKVSKELYSKLATSGRSNYSTKHLDWFANKKPDAQ
jgi:hypothetical protein